MKTYKTYLCYLNYFATGEGLTHCVAVVGAQNEEEAKKIFCEKYMCSESGTEESLKHCVWYFSHGVKVFDFQDAIKKGGEDLEKIKEHLKKFFTTFVIDSMLDAAKVKCLHEFYFKTYTNYN